MSDDKAAEIRTEIAKHEAEIAAFHALIKVHIDHIMITGRLLLLLEMDLDKLKS